VKQYQKTLANSQRRAIAPASRLLQSLCQRLESQKNLKEKAKEAEKLGFKL
jgi:hypothetical protein